MIQLECDYHISTRSSVVYLIVSLGYSSKRNLSTPSVSPSDQVKARIKRRLYIVASPRELLVVFGKGIKVRIVVDEIICGLICKEDHITALSGLRKNESSRKGAFTQAPSRYKRCDFVRIVEHKVEKSRDVGSKNRLIPP